MIWAVLSLVAASVTVLAQTETPAPITPTPIQGAFVFSGHVYKMPAHIAASDATVSLSGSFAPNSVGTWNTISDANGYFEMHDLPSGLYVLTVSLPGYHTVCEQPYQVKIANRSITAFEAKLWPDSRQETCLFIESPAPATKPAATPSANLILMNRDGPGTFTG